LNFSFFEYRAVVLHGDRLNGSTTQTTHVENVVMKKNRHFSRNFISQQPVSQTTPSLCIGTNTLFRYDSVNGVVIHPYHNEHEQMSHDTSSCV
jgi:hypothetical protein